VTLIISIPQKIKKESNLLASKTPLLEYSNLMIMENMMLTLSTIIYSYQLPVGIKWVQIQPKLAYVNMAFNPNDLTLNSGNNYIALTQGLLFKINNIKLDYAKTLYFECVNPPSNVTFLSGI